MPRRRLGRETTSREIPSATSCAPSGRTLRTLASTLLGSAALAGTAAAIPAPAPQTPSTDAVVPLPSVSPVAQASPVPAPEGDAGPAPALAPTAAKPTARKVTSLPLKVGMRGPLVRDMQRELRRRGRAIAVDGQYGSGTVRAVRALQKRFRMPATGTADARFLRRLGLQSLSVAGVSIPVQVTVSDVLPSWVRMDIWPTSGQVTSPFGVRWGRMHEGIDIASNAGPPVVAALAGTVSFAGWESGYGNLVKINHGNGLETRYGHLASIAVAKGQPVATGTQVGVMGSTGRSTGTHLHFEVRVGGTPFNPLGALPARGLSR